MKKGLDAYNLFFSTILYCLSLSWKASRLFTIVRLLGRVVIPVGGIVLSFLVKYIIDLLAGAWAPTDKTVSLIMLLCAFLAITLLISLVTKVIQYCQSMHSDLLNKQISLNLMDKTLGVDIEFFDNPDYYDDLLAASRDSYALVNILWNVLECLSSSLTCIGAFSVLSRINILYGTVVAIAAIPSAYAGSRYTKEIYRMSIKQLKGERQKNYIKDVTTVRWYSQDIRLFDIGGYLKDRYAQLWDSLYSKRKKVLKQRSITTAILDCLPHLAMIGIATDVSFRVMAGSGSVGDYVLLTGLATQLTNALQSLSDSSIQIYDDKLRIARIKKMESFENRVKDMGEVALQKVGTIEFKDVSFSYPGTNRETIVSVSFKVSAGERVALVGLNGSGKTTLIKLLLRYYDPDNGAILINGIDIREYTVNSLRRAFSVYFQDMFNFSFTLRENIQISDMERNGGDNNVIDAINESEASDILKNATQGLDTYLTRLFEDSGMEISGGQGQKISLARTLYRRHSALILDEPSSNLDPEAEHKVFGTLDRLSKGKTTLFTSHRLSNLVFADRIVVIDNGKTIEDGTVNELLANRSKFFELYTYQQEKYKGNAACYSH